MSGEWWLELLSSKDVIEFQIVTYFQPQKSKQENEDEGFFTNLANGGTTEGQSEEDNIFTSSFNPRVCNSDDAELGASSSVKPTFLTKK